VKRFLLCFMLVILCIVSFRLLWAPQKPYSIDFTGIEWYNGQHYDPSDLTFDNIVQYSKTSDQYSTVYLVKTTNGKITLLVQTNDIELYVYSVSDVVAIADF
jgi:hypothetical protein